MAKDKKVKTEKKKARVAEKKEKQEKKGLKKKNTKHSKDFSSDIEDIDLEAVLASYAKEQELFLKVTEIPCDPPKSRASTTLIASPANRNELFIFAGEYFNGALATFFNDLYVYIINKDEWRKITSPNTPLPRSGHAWCRGGNSRNIYLFGGEFSSPKQGTFYHFWQFDPSAREWTRIETKGKSPPARSGHRMTFYKNYIILFGGFQDTSQNTKFLADLWIYDTQKYCWYDPVPSLTQKPDARSSFTFLPHEKGAVLFGGYSRVKFTDTGKQGRGIRQSQKNIYKPVVHQDCFFLRIIQSEFDTAQNPLKIHWERRKKPVNVPLPPRAGATMTYHKNRGIMFGGVHDVEENEEGIESEFFNGLFAWNIERNRFFPLTLRKPKSKPNRLQSEMKSGRRGRGQANEDDLLKNLERLQAGEPVTDTESLEVIKDGGITEESPQKRNKFEFPHVRFNSQLTVQEDVLYIYGGTFEKDDRDLTFDDMYAIDLCRLDGVKQIFHREPEKWYGSDDEESDGEESDEETDDESMAEEGIDGNDKPLLSESSRKSKKDMNLTKNDDATSTIATIGDAPINISDDTLDNDAMNPNSSFPHPRPFESRREFFNRTCNEWQEILMTSLRWKGIFPETLTVKEIKTKAFEMSENHWWDLREEIMALEDEQEAAGIGEIFTLTDMKETSGSFKRR